MARNGNMNHPKRGSSIVVEPIKSRKAIAQIKARLAGSPRDYALFVMGINTGLRVGDLLSLTAGEVRAILADPDGKARPQEKTSKQGRLTPGPAVCEALERLLATREYADDERIFQGQRGPITKHWLWALVKGWCADAGLRGNYGTHTLRKTFGYHQRVTYGVDIPTLMTIFNHSTQRQTLDYLCIQPEEIRSVYANEL